MNDTEALDLLTEQVGIWRHLSYADLRTKIGRPTHLDLIGQSGARYQVDLETFWDDKPEGNIRVLASVDDGGILAFAPRSNGFIKAPDGSFVDE